MLRKFCPVCKCENLTPLLRLPDIPVFDNVLAESPEAAIGVTKGTQSLVQCGCCGFVFNAEFEPEKVIYSTDYHAERGTSSYYQAHIKRVVEFIQKTSPIQGRLCMEIACGNSEFLCELANQKPAKAIGVDPSASPVVERDLEIQRRFFDETYLAEMPQPVDIIINRHMIEHILNPLETLRQFYQALAADGILYLETPRLDWILENKTFFDFPYEHCAYYTDRFLERLLKAAGFDIVAKEYSYGGQYFSICAKKGKNHFVLDPVPPEELTKTRELFSAVSHVYSALLMAEKLQGCIATLRTDVSVLKLPSNGLYFWGAAAKGVMCANLLDQWLVEGFIDKNPYKQGKFIPGTGHIVLAPNEIKYPRVKVVVVENDVYYPEIFCQLQKIDRQISAIKLSDLLKV